MNSEGYSSIKAFLNCRWIIKIKIKVFKVKVYYILILFLCFFLSYISFFVDVLFGYYKYLNYCFKE